MPSSSDILRCPCPHHSTLNRTDDQQYICQCSEGEDTNGGNHFFPLVNGKPVMIFSDSPFCDRGSVINTSAQSVIRRHAGIQKFVSKLIFGNPVGDKQAINSLLSYMQETSKPIRVLVIGAGEGSILHNRAENLEGVEVIGVDVYDSQATQIICDAHELPFADAVFDAVIIQAVLEHVIEPKTVVGEIYRVLKTAGVVYAETPFMQQVHEGRFDYTRFSHLGHRWLFRMFEEVRSGVLKGPGTAFLWSLRYLIASIIGNKRIAALLVLPLFWLRFLDYIARPSNAHDSASEYFFLGRKSHVSLTYEELIAGYRGAQ